MADTPKSERASAISLHEAYSVIFDTYRSNIEILKKMKDENSDIAADLIDNLPEPSEATELEMRAVLQEVVGGRLTWGYSLTFEKQTMDDYARAATEPYGGWQVSREEIEELRFSSLLWPYLTPGVAAYRVNQAKQYIEEHDPKAAEDVLRHGMEEARGNNDVQGEIEVGFKLQDILVDTERIDEAFSLVEHILKLSSDVGSVLDKYGAFAALGELYRRTGQLDKALDYKENALSLIDTRTKSFPDTYVLMLKTLDEMEEIYQEKEDERGIESIRSKMENTFLNAIEIAKGEKDTRFETILQYELGEFYTRTGREKEASQVLKQAVGSSQQLDDVLQKIDVFRALSGAYRKMGDTGGAEEMLQKALSLTDDKSIPDGETAVDAKYEVLHDLQGLLEEAGRVEEATTVREQAERLKSSVRLDSEEGEVEHVTPHQLRHYFATHTLSSGADVKAVSEMLGHADVGITLKIYHHVNARAIREMHREYSPLTSVTMSLCS